MTHPGGGLFVLLLLATTWPAIACPAKHVPDASRIDSYVDVFVGEVVGVRLSGYLQLREQRGGDVTVDSTPRYEVEVRVIQRLRGTPAPLVKLEAGGCAVREPGPREIGLFAVPASGLALAIYESESSYARTRDAFRAR